MIGEIHKQSIQKISTHCAFYPRISESSRCAGGPHTEKTRSRLTHDALKTRFRCVLTAFWASLEVESWASRERVVSESSRCAGYSHHCLSGPRSHTEKTRSRRAKDACVVADAWASLRNVRATMTVLRTPQRLALKTLASWTSLRCAGSTVSRRLERVLRESWANLEDQTCLIFRKRVEVFWPRLDLVSTASCLKTWYAANLRLRRDTKIPFTNDALKTPRDGLEERAHREDSLTTRYRRVRL